MLLMVVVVARQECKARISYHNYSFVSKGYFLDSSVTMKRHPSHVALELAIYGKERAMPSCYFEFKKKAAQ